MATPEKPGILNSISLIVSIAAAVVVLWYQPSEKEIALEVSRLNLQKGKTELSQSERKFDIEFKFSVIDRVLTAIRNEKKGEIEIAKAMVITMLSDDEATQRQLLLAIEQNQPSGSVESKTILSEIHKLDSFKLQEKKLVALSLPTGKESSKQNIDTKKIMLVDVFYLEDTKETSEAQAKNVKSILEESHKYGKVRIRMLPSIVNNRSGYQLIKNEIRFDSFEDDQATELFKILNAKGYEFDLSESNSNTPAYLSCFITK